jgi:hypothetical protein
MPSLKTWEWMALAGVALLILWYFRPSFRLSPPSSPARGTIPTIRTTIGTFGSREGGT